MFIKIISIINILFFFYNFYILYKYESLKTLKKRIDFIENTVNKMYKETDVKSNDTNNDNSNEKKIFNNSEKYNIKLFSKNKNNFYEYIKKELKIIDDYKNEISEKTQNDMKSININEVSEYRIKKENINIGRKSSLRKRMKRCLYLHNLYNNRLHIVDFSIKKLEEMSEDNWNKWLTKLYEFIHKHDY